MHCNRNGINDKRVSYMAYHSADIKKLKRLITLLLRFDAAPKTGINLQQFAAAANVNIRTIQRDIQLLNDCLCLTDTNKKRKAKAEKTRQTAKKTGKRNTEFRYIKPNGYGNYSFAEGYTLANAQQEKIFHDTIEPLAKSLGISPTFFRAYWRLSPQDNPFFIKFPQLAEPLQLFKGFEILLDSIQKQYAVNVTRQLKGKKPLVWQNFKPLKICFSEGFWYLIGYQQSQLLKCHLENIVNVEAKKPVRYFEYNEEQDPQKAIEYILNKSVNMWFNLQSVPQKMELFVDKSIAGYFKQKFYFPQQEILKETAEGIRLSCQYSDNLELEKGIFPVIREWLPHIYIVAPSKIAQQFKQELQEYIQSHP